MVKPPLRTKSIGFKVSEEEYARLETAAQAEGRTLGEWCREAILRGGSGSDLSCLGCFSLEAEGAQSSEPSTGAFEPTSLEPVDGVPGRLWLAIRSW